MARKKTINPCVNKGRDYGAKAQGRLYRDTLESKFQRGCECALAFVCQGMTTRSANVAKFGEIKELTFQDRLIGLSTTLTTTRPESNSPLTIVPCAGKFLDRNSEATLTYRKQLRRLGVNKGQLFPGCQIIEEDLVDAGEIIVRPTESVLKASDPQEKTERQGMGEDVDGMTESEKLIYLGTAASEVFTLANFNDRFLESSEESKFIDRVAQTELTEDAVTESRDVVTIYDDLYEAAQIDEATDDLNEQIRIFKKTLTPKQRKAYELLWDSFATGQSRIHLARQLKISVDSFNERISYAAAKFKKIFPKADLNNFQFGGRNKSEAALAPPAPVDPRYQAGPVKWWQNGQPEAVLVQIGENNPTPFGPKKLRPDVDRDEIKRRLKEEEFLKVKFLTIRYAPGYERDLPGDKVWTAQILRDLYDQDSAFRCQQFKGRLE